MQLRDDIKFVDLPRNIPEVQGFKKSFVQYLIESEIRPLIFVGKTMQYFGTKVVISFVFGVLILYGYALFKPLPYATSHAKTILLHGKVINGEEKPLTDFVIGVLESKHGPIKKEDGSFTIEVPLKTKYSLIIWDNKNETYSLYGDLDIKFENGKYSLIEPLPDFPTDLGLIEGIVKNQDGIAVQGYIEVKGQVAPIMADGYFSIRNIQIGKTTIRVHEKGGEVLYEEDIDIDLHGTTPKDITIKIKEGSW